LVAAGGSLYFGVPPLWFGAWGERIDGDCYVMWRIDGDVITIKPLTRDLLERGRVLVTRRRRGEGAKVDTDP